MDLGIMILLLVGLVVSASICVLLHEVLKSAVAMAIVSALLSIIMFILKAPLAAVFELSVCAGLITVIFISAISMTKLRTKEELEKIKKKRRKRYVLLPVLLIVCFTAALFLIWPNLNALLPYDTASVQPAVGLSILWEKRQVDLLGQIVIILAGVFGVLIFFKEEEKE